VFDQFGDWLGRLWYRAGEWVASHVGTEEPRQPQPDERYLGVPRLPRAVEIPEIEVDSFVVAPFDPSVIEVPLPPDTMLLDSMTVDTIMLDTVTDSVTVPDSVGVLPPDTVQRHFR
jgi:hypothetical protein